MAVGIQLHDRSVYSRVTIRVVARLSTEDHTAVVPNRHPVNEVPQVAAVLGDVERRLGQSIGHGEGCSMAEEQNKVFEISTVQHCGFEWVLKTRGDSERNRAADEIAARGK